MEDLHGDLLSLVLLQSRALDLNVGALGLSGEWDLFVDSASILGLEGPVSDGDRNESDQKEDEVGRPSRLERNQPLYNPRSNDIDNGELSVGE